MGEYGICPGVCNTRWRKAQAAWKQAVADYDPLDPETSRPGPPDIKPMAGYPWCLECRSAISLQLGELDYLAALRRLAELGADGYPADAGAERVSGSREHTSPSPATDDVDDTAAMLAGWEAAYRDLKGWPSAIRHGYLADQRTECISWLAERLDAILDSPCGEEVGREILEWHADLKAKTKAGVRLLRKPLRCPVCRYMLLKWTEGERDVHCYNPDCGVIMSLAEYESKVDTLAAELKKGGIPLALEIAQVSGAT